MFQLWEIYDHKSVQCLEKRNGQEDNSKVPMQMKIKPMLVGASNNVTKGSQNPGQLKKSNSKYGSWMVATLRKQRKQQKSQNVADGNSKDKNVQDGDTSKG